MYSQFFDIHLKVYNFVVKLEIYYHSAINPWKNAIGITPPEPDKHVK